MTNKTITQLTAATLPLAGTETVPITQGGVTVKATNNDFRPKQIQSNTTTGVLQIAGPTAAAPWVVNRQAASIAVLENFITDRTTQYNQ